jgi:hypothetical protein
MDVLELKEKDKISYGSTSIRDDFITNPSSSGAWDAEQLPYNPSNVYSWDSTATISEVKNLGLLDIWSGEHGTITQFTLLDDEENQVLDLLFQFRASTSIHHIGKIVNRLDTLMHDAKEEDSSQVGINVDSLRNFIAFLRLHNNLKYPFITLTPDGNIYVSWREVNRVFSVQFLRNKDTRFVIFKPNNLHPKRKIRIAGIATIDVLQETVSPHGIWDWISE